MATKKAAGTATRSKTGTSAVAKKSAAKKVAPAKSAASTRQTSAKTASSRAKSSSTEGGARKAAATKAPAKRAAAKKKSSDDKYTDPALRDGIKERITRGDKGGRAGQWSARKAQMVAHEYEAEGGKYKGALDETQKSLTAWGDEHWTTQDGKPARQADGMHRYLPEEAWKELTSAEKQATEKKKKVGDRAGKQFVANTGAAVKARRHAEKKASKP